MKSKSFFYLGLVLLCFLTNSCKEPEDDVTKPPIDIPIDQVNVVWERYTNADSNISYLCPLKIDGNKIIAAVYFNSTENLDYRGIALYDKFTGQPISDWPVNELGIGNVTSSFITDYMSCGISQDVWVFQAGSKTLAYNFSRNEKLWERSYTILSPMNKLSPFGKDVILGLEKEGYSEVSLGRLHYQDGRFEKFFSFTLEDEYSKKMLPMPVAYMVNSQMDTLLFFSLYIWNYTLIEGHIHAICYNLNKREIVWKKEDFTSNCDPKNFVPIIHNNKVILSCTHSMHCFDINTGEILWQKYLSNDNFTFIPPLLHNGRLYVQTFKGEFICMDPNNGGEFWKKKHCFEPNHIGRMAIYNGLLYCTGYNLWDNALLAISTATGNIEKKISFPNEQLEGGVTIDESTGLLYCSSRRKVYCIDIKNY